MEALLDDTLPTEYVGGSKGGVLRGYKLVVSAKHSGGLLDKGGPFVIAHSIDRRIGLIS